jgi:hypothetical protein
MGIGGEITMSRDGKTETFRSGESSAVIANHPNAEQVCPQGVAFIVGCRAAKA